MWRITASVCVVGDSSFLFQIFITHRDITEVPLARLVGVGDVAPRPGFFPIRVPAVIVFSQTVIRMRVRDLFVPLLALEPTFSYRDVSNVANSISFQTVESSPGFVQAQVTDKRIHSFHHIPLVQVAYPLLTFVIVFIRTLPNVTT